MTMARPSLYIVCVILLLIAPFASPTTNSRTTASSSTTTQGDRIQNGASASQQQQMQVTMEHGGLELFLGSLSLIPHERRCRSPNLQIIGAGMPKTGTKSLQTALEMLGYVQSIIGLSISGCVGFVVTITTSLPERSLLFLANY